MFKGSMDRADLLALTLQCPVVPSIVHHWNPALTEFLEAIIDMSSKLLKKQTHDLKVSITTTNCKLCWANNWLTT